MKSNQSRRRPRFQPAAEVAGQVEILGCVPRSVRGCWENFGRPFSVMPRLQLGRGPLDEKIDPNLGYRPFRAASVDARLSCTCCCFTSVAEKPASRNFLPQRTQRACRPGRRPCRFCYRVPVLGLSDPGRTAAP